MYFKYILKRVLLKFIYSEKAFLGNLHRRLSYVVVAVKSAMEISQNFVAILEYVSFNKCIAAQFYMNIKESSNIDST